MRIIFRILFVLFLLLPVTVQAENPDGDPGRPAIEPFLSFQRINVENNRRYDDLWAGGLKIIIPIAEQSTVFASFSLGESMFFKRELSFTISIRLWSE